MNYNSRLAAALIFQLVTVQTPALAIQCPVPHATNSPGVIVETPHQIATYGEMLLHGDTGNAVSEIIYILRQKYPNASDEEIANFLITAYCPVVARQNYSEAEATAKVRKFAKLVEARIYRAQ